MVKNVNALYLWDRVVLVGLLVAFFKSLSLFWEANKIIPLFWGDLLLTSQNFQLYHHSITAMGRNLFPTDGEVELGSDSNPVSHTFIQPQLTRALFATVYFLHLHSS